MQKYKAYSMAIIIILAASFSLFACQRKVDDMTDCHYQPWDIDEYQLFGLTKEQIISTYPLEFLPESSSFADAAQRYNVEFDKEKKVLAVRRYFVGCKHTYYGPWLASKVEALDFSIKGLANFEDKKSKAKLAEAKEQLAKLSRNDASSAAPP